MEARAILAESGQRTIADEALCEQLSHKWAGILKGLDDPYVRNVTAVLLENQMDHLQSLNEETLSTGVGSFTKYIFPILRRVFPNLIANQIVSVQPMTAPVGGIFTYEYKYGDTKGNVTKGQNLVETFNRYFSSEFVDYEVKVASAGDAAQKWNDGTNSSARVPFQWLPVKPKATGVGTPDPVVTISWTDKVLNAAGPAITDDGAGNLKMTASDGLVYTVGAIDYTTGIWSIDLTVADGKNAGTTNYGTKTLTKITATYSYNSEKVGTTASAKVPEISIDIALTTVTAGSRKLATSWSAEAVDDLKAFHGLDAETELVAGIANQIALELDREIVTDIQTGAKYTATYNHSATWGGQAVHTELDSIRGLMSVLDAVGAKIHVGSKRARPNWIVAAPDVCAMLDQMTTHGDFMAINKFSEVTRAPTYGNMNSDFGIQKIGTVGNKYTLFQDPFMDSGVAIMGIKGKSFLDAGYVYAPYIPLQMTSTFEDPETFRYKKGMRTRYAKKLLRPEFYGKVTVTGLPNVTTNA